MPGDTAGAGKPALTHTTSLTPREKNRGMTTRQKLACRTCNQPATAAKTDRNATLDLCIKCSAAETMVVPAESERRQRAPEGYMQGAAGALLRKVQPDGDIWAHQSEALGTLEQGDNLVVSTATASGKSLIFQAHGLKVTTESESTALVLYPIKALGNDQAEKWMEAAQTAGLQPSSIGRIDGDTAMQCRTAILRTAKIVAITPDVCHAWLLRTQGQNPQAEFLRRLRLIIIDEAHTYDSVFGSNAAYMFRRLLNAAGNRDRKRVQIIAATATILEPDRHLESLTGEKFTTITQEQCGAPRHERTIHHLAVDGGPQVLEHTAARLMKAIIDADDDAQIITFHDSRQGVERIVQYAGGPGEIVPYRSGYLGSERKTIENQIRQRTIRGVVSTSALEMGIDMPDLTYGINVGLPTTRKQLHQRLGRIGRSRAGVFVIVASPSQFDAYGDSMRDYILESVESTNLYIYNEHIAYHQARCLKNELEARGKSALTPPAGCTWPEGFQKMLREAHSRTPRLNARNNGSGPPQLAHTMRSTGEEELALTRAKNSQGQSQQRDKIGTISLPYAMSEAYPGAIYRHYGRCYVVEAWARDRATKEGKIKVRQTEPMNTRTHRLERQIAVIDEDQTRRTGDVRQRRNGLYETTAMEIIQSVEGYVETGEAPVLYETLSKFDPGKSRKQRAYGTTGIHITVDEDWFQGEASNGWANRIQIGRTLVSHLCYRRSIAGADVDFVADNIFLKSAKGCVLSGNSLVIYDNVIGGLGLTNHLYEDMEGYASRMLKAAVDHDQKTFNRLDRSTATAFLNWLESEERSRGPSRTDEQKWWRVLLPGSRVRYYSARKQAIDEGQTEEPIWEDGVKYVLRNSEGAIELEPLNEEALQYIRPPDWQLWMPGEDRYQKIRID